MAWSLMTHSGHLVLKAQINKTDRNDARGIAQMRRASEHGPARFPSRTRTEKFCSVIPAPRSRRAKMPGNAEENWGSGRNEEEIDREPGAIKASWRYECATILYASRTSKRIERCWIPQHSGCATSTRQGVSHSRWPRIRLFAGGSSAH